MREDQSQRREQKDWEAIFHGSRRKVSTAVIGSEADFLRRKAAFRETAEGLLRELKDLVNLSYESDAAIGGTDWGRSGNPLRMAIRKKKPAFESLLKFGSSCSGNRKRRPRLLRLATYPGRVLIRMGEEGRGESRRRGKNARTSG